VAITSFFELIEKSEERREWIFILKNLIVMDRCVEEKVMLHEIAKYHNRYLEEFQGSSLQSSSLSNRLIQLYFHHIRNKAAIYEERKYAIALEKA
jgi:hypothetical protein